MDDRTRVGLCVGLGAVIGGLAGYLFLTDRGREMRVQLEPRLDDLMGEVQRLASSFDRTRRAVEEGWRSFNQLVADEGEAAADAWKSTARH